MKIQKEIDIIDNLSRISNSNNSFLKFYGAFSDDNNVTLLLESYKKTLLELINDYEKKGIKLDEKIISKITTKLIISFTELTQLNIYHENIHPASMLVINDLDIKIANFYNGPDIYHYDIKEKVDSNSSDEIKEKNEVYLLGLTIFHMITQINPNSIPIKNKFKKLSKYISSSSNISSNFKAIIISMLTENHKRRPKFEALVQQCVN